MVNRIERERILLNSYRMLDNDDDNGLNRVHSITCYPDTTWLIKKDII